MSTQSRTPSACRCDEIGRDARDVRPHRLGAREVRAQPAQVLHRRQLEDGVDHGRRKPGFPQLGFRNVARLARELVEHRVHGGLSRFLANADFREQRVEQAPVGHPRANVAGVESQLLHDRDGDRQQFRVRQLARLADDVDVQLIVLPQPPALGTLVPEQLGDREPAHGLAEGVRAFRHHAGERRRHLGPQGHLAAALVGEVVQLAGDLVAALLRVQVERLQGRAVVLDERESPGDLTPGPEDVGPLRELVWIEVSEPGKRSASHATKLAAGRTYLQTRHGVAHGVKRPGHEHGGALGGRVDQRAVEVPDDLRPPATLAGVVQRVGDVPGAARRSGWGVGEDESLRPREPARP